MLRICSALFFLQLTCLASAKADIIPITNAGFEDTTGQTTFNEFTFGVPLGWDLHNPSGLLPNAGVFTGTLEPNGTDFFNDSAPEGDLVAILFNSAGQGDGEYGIQQTLSTNLQANTNYTLTVEVGNIASGIATNGTFFNLDEFPGYRVELLAGDTVIAQDLNSLTIAEAEFETSTVSFTTGSSHALLGEALGVRLVNLNVIPAGFTQATSPDLEVDFDQVQLSTTAVPEPGVLPILFIALGTTMFRRSRKPKT